MRITIEGDTDKVLDFLENNGIRVTDGFREYDFNGWSCYLDRADFSETQNTEWIPRQNTAYITLFLRKSVTKERLEAAEESFRKAKGRLPGCGRYF